LHLRFRNSYDLGGSSDLCARVKPDPSILPVRRPTCSRCNVKMAAISAAAGPEGFETYTFECNRCGLRDVKIIACDPLKSDAIGWASGELGRSGAGNE
jgi:hypothetical protein